MKNSKNILSGLFAAALLTLASTSVQAATYSFTQGGYSDGATFTGTFQGIDYDHNGVLVTNEIWAFAGIINGGYWNGLTIENRNNGSVNFQYNLDSSILGDNPGEGISVYYRGWDIDFYAGNGGRVTGFPSEPSPYTSQFVQVTQTSPVPEPETWGMMLAGLGLLAFLGKRKKAANAA